ncbi:PREDICTED: glycosylphosphatidylinositol anchor attachment 1 protein [Tarenaya hassleriana]|uniref:glycosylphosphatidylinositol anchor attachment 1 protein n=1 Tax=Tarenaya hassleriana TaxID=28532 RepID=UPI00053C338A|nr:PREDICTED: glycosylphosphatidylinositol anchor attachment 1 protein [Tarenaya hassleriana]XP_010555157.1 PREDICTED: glycosylphosphatidylinositol anchor attachment 1 protein [Tarenaya hassleriana]XP_010555158.1 PREDICTED: glycosylphosphatidylinositol anchor attachment 1 protein [Tarenaya hassleriana]XP_010555159.1 PREDICTED: glycosylphosphatidylinositol anchor attachment 1 protein [Tarenaya hassleriana]
MAADKETEVKFPDGSPEMKPRPIVRLGMFLISHSPVFSVICSVAGILVLFLLPVLAKNTYISENALMPGSAHSMLSNQDVLDGSEFVMNIKDLRLKRVEAQVLIGEYMSNLGAQVYHHKFFPEMNRFHSLMNSSSSSSYGINSAGIIRAPRGDGKECIVLVTPYDHTNDGNDDEVFSLGIAYTVFSLLSRVTWLAKDIVWLVADSRYGDYRSVDAWLSEYYAPSFNTSDNFIRAGTMAAALVLKVNGRGEVSQDTISIYAEAANGQMPNLDIINVVNYLGVHRQGFSVKVEKVASLLSSGWLKIVGETFEAAGKMAKTLNPDWNFGISAADYVEGSATLASSLYYQALGVPTGPHGAFRNYQVDAVTLKFTSRFPPKTKLRKQQELFLRGARVIEGTIRSVNNLLEKFHQSFFLYLLTSPSKFVSVGVYMIAFALLIAPLPMVAASLYMDASSTLPKATDKYVLKSWIWLDAAKRVFSIHVWGVVITLLPYLIPGHHMAAWVISSSSSSLALLVIPGCSPFTKWTMLKSVTISATFIGLCLMSIVNFAAAEIGALMLVPMCLMCQPIRQDVRSRSPKSLLRALCNMVLVTTPMVVLISKGGSTWDWVESLWEWKSATYLYIGLACMPCWLLCISILLHP